MFIEKGDIKMYDEFIICDDLIEIKEQLDSIIEEGNEDVDLDEIKETVQDLYDRGKMSSKDYDELINQIEDIESEY